MENETNKPVTGKEAPNATKVKEGDTIQLKTGELKGKKGTVIIVRENSVIVDVGKSEETGEPRKTVINHRNYKIVK
ncbi:DUF2187 family protein [Bacillus sp. CGMCC 1.16541]|uniref:DUF2187 family protein n=1 Tax=Bacillus sp. CGMCC 1.16541 TaxID=2185143 RepID=UPI000D7298CF|nr:DUF2187 family protein [Bacillus sp. CGMCC 1.16541]